MAEYAKMKNADLEALLKDRKLPVGGKKADMVTRLTHDDESKEVPSSTGLSEAPVAPAKIAVTNSEDEIDWDDDDVVAPIPAPAAEVHEPAPTAAATIANNVPALPNQVADIDAPKTDLSVKELASEEKPEEKKEEEKKEPAPDYTRGLAPSSLEDEIEKRKKRAAKFGLKVEEDEGLKKLERLKKFGENGPPKGLDEALPERNARKRGREANDQGGRGGKQRRGDKSGGGLQRERGPRDVPRDGPKRRDDRADKGRSTNGGGNLYSEADKLKAEERKKKWAAAQ